MWQDLVVNLMKATISSGVKEVWQSGHICVAGIKMAFKKKLSQIKFS